MNSQRKNGNFNLKLLSLNALAIALVAWLWAPQPARAGSCPEAAVVERAANALIAAARAGSSAKFANAMKTYADMRAIALFALGKHRKKLPAARQGEFVEQTTQFVAETFKDYRLKFRADSLRIMDCRGKMIHSRLEFLGAKPAQKVIWRMKGKRISDVNIQNAWLGQLLRTHYDAVMSKSGGDINALFRELKS